MLRCSACNTPNPSDHTFCGYCGSRLSAPSSNDQPLPSWLGGNNDAPTTAHAPPADTALPPWLATPDDRTNITQPINTTQADEDAADERPSALQSQDAAQASGADDTSTLPPWLSSPTASTPNDVPDWLHAETTDSSRSINTPQRSTATPAGTPPPTTGTDDALPDWLFDVDTASGDVPVLPEQTPPGVKMMRDSSNNTPPTFGDTATPPASEESLDWLLNPQQAADPATDTLPDWLRDDVPAPSAEVESTPPTDQSDLPSWLRDESPTTPPTQRSTANVESAQQDQFSSAAAPPNTSDSLPAWLRDDVVAPPSEQGRVTTPLPIDEPAAGTNNGAAQRNDEGKQETIPAWLRDDPGTATIEAVPHIDSLALPLIESEPFASADLQKDTTAAETASSPATTARVYDLADDVAAEPVALVAGDGPQPEPAFASSAASPPESAPAAQPAVYDVPQPDPAPPATEADILAAITQPAAAAAPSIVATPTTAVASPATPSSTPSPERAPTMAPPPRRQRGNGLWIVLTIVLLLAILAVGWLALRFNGIL